LQAEAIKSAILAHRAQKPYCMGSLFWQINDCWPAASWSSIDYYGTWKALQYFAKKAYAPVAISFFPDKNNVRIFLNSDLSEPMDVKMIWRILDFDGKVLSEQQIESRLDPNRSVEVFTVTRQEVKKLADPSTLLLQVSLMEDENLLATDNYYFAVPKDLKLPKAKVNATLRNENRKIVMDLTSDKLAKNVYLSIDGCKGHFSDNFFDLLPGEKTTITLVSCDGKEIEASDLKIIMLNNLIVSVE